MSLKWGVIRYAAGSGWCPDADCAAFDGWYLLKPDAQAIYQSWCRKYPNWVVALVQSHAARFPDADWSRLIDRSILPDGTLCPLKRDTAPK